MSTTTERSSTDDLTFAAPGPGIWTLDRAHFPRPAAPYLRAAVADGVTAGTATTFRRYGYPLRGVTVAWLHGRCYFRIAPLLEGGGQSSGAVADVATWLVTRLHPEFRRRTSSAARAFDTQLWAADLAAWQQDTEPVLRRRNLSLQAVALAERDDDELVAHLAEVTENLRDGLRIHYELFPAYAIPLGRLVLAGMRHGLSTSDILRGLRGHSPGSAEPRRRIAAIAAALPDPGEVTTLDEVAAAGPDAAAALADYLLEFGNHVVGSLDADELTVGELPELLLHGIRVAGKTKLTEPTEPTDRAVPTALRERVPAGERAGFDALFAEAAASFQLRDENVGVTELWPAGLVRRALREAGGRLAERGQVEDWRQVFETEPAELAGLLRGAGPSAAELSERSWRRRRQAEVTAPPVLPLPANESEGDGGVPDPERALLVMPRPLAKIGLIMTKMAPLYESPAASVPLTGTGVGSAAYVGRARVVRDATEALRRLEPGDVLVSGTTTPAFNTVLPVAGALVVEHGGELSHSAIMANELGIPAVVGVRAACELIRDGQEIEVDPGAGVVKIRM